MIKCDHCKRDISLHEVSGIYLILRDEGTAAPYYHGPCHKLMLSVPRLGDICRRCASELQDKIVTALKKAADSEIRQFMELEPALPTSPTPSPPPPGPAPRRIRENKQPEKKVECAQEIQPIADGEIVARGIAMGIVNHLRLKYRGDITSCSESPLSLKEHYELIIDNLTPIIARLLLGCTGLSR